MSSSSSSSYNVRDDAEMEEDGITEMVTVGDHVQKDYNENTVIGELQQNDKEVNWFSSPFYLYNFFTKSPDGATARCNCCPSTSPHSIKVKDGNTSGLDSHLSRKHRKDYEKYLKKKDEVMEKRREIRDNSVKRKYVGQDLFKTKQSKLSCINGILDMKPPPTDPKFQREFINSVVNFAVECGISFNALSGPAFCGMVGVLNKHSRFKVDVISRINLAKHVTKNAEELLKDITAIIKSCRGDMECVSFTSDIWTSGNSESFISLTVHWIDKEWILHRWTPFVKHFPDRHTGKLIKVKLDEMIRNLGLDSQDIIKYVVNDNAANAVLSISPDLIQILCSIHTLQLSVGDTFNDASVGPTKMKSVLEKGKSLAKLVKKSGAVIKAGLCGGWNLLHLLEEPK